MFEILEDLSGVLERDASFWSLKNSQMIIMPFFQFYRVFWFEHTNVQSRQIKGMYLCCFFISPFSFLCVSFWLRASDMHIFVHFPHLRLRFKMKRTMGICCTVTQKEKKQITIKPLFLTMHILNWIGSNWLCDRECVKKSKQQPTTHRVRQQSEKKRKRRETGNTNKSTRQTKRWW